MLVEPLLHKLMSAVPTSLHPLSPMTDAITVSIVPILLNVSVDKVIFQFSAKSNNTGTSVEVLYFRKHKGNIEMNTSH